MLSTHNNNVLENQNHCLIPLYNSYNKLNTSYNDNEYNYKRATERSVIDQCGVILLNGSTSNPQVLLIFQTESQKWGLPKGHLTNKEKYQKNYYVCAKRELFEETGVIISTNKHKKFGTLLLNNKLFYVVHIFKKFLYVQPIDTTEISGYTWCPVMKLDSFIAKHDCNRTVKDLENIMMTVKKNKDIKT